MALFDVGLPTLDVYSDLSLIIPWLIAGHWIYGLSMTIPLLLQFVSTIYKWIKIEKREDKKWSWIFLILQLWPQLTAIRVIKLLYKNDPSANDKKKEFNSEVGCTEPFLEAWPSFIIMTIICFSTIAGPDQGVNQDAVFGNSMAKFFAVYGISVFSCCFGITKLLQIGPCPVLIEEGILGGVLNCRFIIHFLAVMFSTLTKAVCVAFVIVISVSDIKLDYRMQSIIVACYLSSFQI